MCDPGEQISQTLKREFMEEAADSHGMTDKDRLEVEEHLKVFFENGTEVNINIYLVYNSFFNLDFFFFQVIQGLCR